MMKNRLFLFFTIVWIQIYSQQSQIQYLSGTDAHNTVPWEFYCSDGMNSKQWTTIAVPSCWEQQGFGQYQYGRDPFEERLKEVGTYKHDFSVPKNWNSKEVLIVFEGVMTDAKVKINGKVVGPIHQGAFYEFHYDISRFLHYGKQNTLEVEVKKFSDNESVSFAERKADYWVFGGIFRPVYLEAKPRKNIQRVAIDARADGSFKADVFTSQSDKSAELDIEFSLDKEETKYIKR